MANEKMTPEEFRKRYVLGQNDTPSSKTNKYNAQKTEVDGITFDSKHEAAVYRVLTLAGIKVQLQKRYVIVPSCTYRGRKQRTRTVKIDFYLPEHNVLIDAKGRMVGDASLRYAMLRYLLAQKKNPPAFIVVEKKHLSYLIEDVLNQNFTRYGEN